MTIQKDLEQNEEKVLLNNILSLVQQLLQNEEAEPMQEEDNVQTGYELEPKEDVSMGLEEGEEEEKKEEDEVTKSTIDTSSDAATANDDAEGRIEDPLTDITEETIDEVAKAILKKMNFKTGVKKSAKNDSSSSNKILAELVKINKGLLARQAETENAIGILINGLGIAKEIENNYSVNKEKEIRKGLNNPQDIEATLAFIAKSLNIKKEEENKSESNIDKVRKTLGNESFLKNLIVKR